MGCATSAGGTSSAAVTIKRDADAPVVVVLSPGEGLSVRRNQSVYALYACLDLRSGTARCDGSAAAFSRIDTSTIGNKTFTVTGRDRAGNVRTVTTHYSVH